MDTHARLRGRAAATAGDTAFLQSLFDRLDERCHPAPAQAPWRPFVTLSYAQSIDGSIAARPARPVALSSEESFDMTHLLRSRHDALLVGIDTVLADDPRLTVRRCAGDNPRPVVLDSRLRFPVDARLLTHPDRYPLVLTTELAGAAEIRRLEGRGAVVRVLPRDDAGRVDLAAALRCLCDMGIRTLMVEGGARVIGSFLGRRLVDHCVITVAPRLIGGVKALDGPCSPDLAPLSIVDCRYQPLGGDLIVHGSLRGSGSKA
ncbi:MAG: RibD family protein [Burkholderiaceae bacterium]